MSHYKTHFYNYILEPDVITFNEHFYSVNLESVFLAIKYNIYSDLCWK